MAFQIVRHAFSMIFGNFGQALRISVGPYLLLVAAVLMCFAAAGLLTNDLSRLNEVQNFGLSGALIVFALIVFAIFVFGWVAVAWHRFILKEEYAGFLPAIARRPIGSYVWTSVLAGLLVALTSFAVGFIGGLLIALIGLQNSFLGEFVLGLAIGVLTGYVWFRIALVLPACAISKPMRIPESWAQTERAKNTIFQVVLIMVGINLLIQLLLASLIWAPVPAFLVVGVAAYWLNFMVGLSILTTLYGHLVENRPLVE